VRHHDAIIRKARQENAELGRIARQGASDLETERRARADLQSRHEALLGASFQYRAESDELRAKVRSLTSEAQARGAENQELVAEIERLQGRLEAAREDARKAADETAGASGLQADQMRAESRITACEAETARAWSLAREYATQLHAERSGLAGALQLRWTGLERSHPTLYGWLARPIGTLSGLSRRARRGRAGAYSLFDADWYVSQYPEAAADPAGPWHHYQEHGARDGLQPNALFDPAWYRQRYPDVDGMDPVEHYCRFGAWEGRDPSAGFSTSGYLAAYPDVVRSGMNPLAHYLRFGSREHRQVPPAQAIEPAASPDPAHPSPVGG
jgi:hypothetical protein